MVLFIFLVVCYRPICVPASKLRAASKSRASVQFVCQRPICVPASKSRASVQFVYQRLSCVSAFKLRVCFRSCVRVSRLCVYAWVRVSSLSSSSRISILYLWSPNMSFVRAHTPARFARIIKGNAPHLALSKREQLLKICSFYKLFPRNIWLVSEKAIPLHPLSRTNAISQMNDEACFDFVMASVRIKRTTSAANATEVSLETSNQKKEFFEKDLHKTEK